jgi:hypothetical protein
VPAGSAVGPYVGLGEQPAGDDSLGGGVIPITGQPAAWAGSPFPPLLTGAVWRQGVAQGRAAAGAELGGATCGNADDRDSSLGAQVPDGSGHTATDLARQPGVALAPTAGLKRGQILYIDDTGI